MRNGINNLRSFGKFRLDPEKKVLWFGEEPIDLPLKEIELLCLLTENNGQLLTKEQILDQIWADSFVEENNLSRHIYRLRKLFAERGETGDLIQTVPRRGYRFNGQVHQTVSRELIIEKHSFTQTLIEELENSAEPNLKAIPRAGHRPQRMPSFWLVTSVLLISIITLSIYYLNPGKQPSVSNQPVKSIAVLPLKSIGDLEADRALGLGFADALITDLGKIDELKVLSVRAVSRYADETQEPLEIGRNLGVDAIIDGSVQKANGKLRVTLRLLRIADGKQIWSNSFDRSEAEIFDLQDLMATQTAHFLSFNLKQTAQPPTVDQDAYQLYLQGVYLFRRRDRDLYKSTEFFQKAIELDPKFAKAWALLAGCYAMGVSMDKAETTVNRALELKPDLAEAHAVRGFIKMFHDWDWAETERSLNEAVKLDPKSVEAHHWRGTYLAIRGRFDESVAEMKRAIELDPVSANMILDLGQIYYFAHDYQKAEEFYRKAGMIDESLSSVTRRLLILYERQGREREAYQMRLIDNCRGYHDKRKSECLNELKNAFEAGGPKGIAALNLKLFLDRLNDKKFQSAVADNWYGVALNYLQLGKKNEAIDSLNRSLNTKNPYEIMNFTLPFIAVEPSFDELHGDPQFHEILRKMNLP
jgi:DNA-binding winged helix-turn-helix (wHTH) protein/TolB-like protein/Flp pilus assembly protein TadD